MNIRKTFDKLLAANIFSFLVIGKFAVLALWTMSGIPEDDLFGQYTLCIGLVAAFYAVAGMRGRLFVLRAIHRIQEFQKFTQLMFIIGIIASVIVFLLNQNSPLLLLIALVAGTRFGEIFLNANSSFIQNLVSREKSFEILNRHGWLVLITFTCLLPFGFKFALVAEIGLILITIFFQQRCIGLRHSSEDANKESTSIWNVFRGGIEFTVTSALNATTKAAFIYYVSNQFETADVYLIAKIIAIQAIGVRFIVSNNIFFRSEIEDNLGSIKLVLVRTSIFVWVILALLIGCLEFSSVEMSSFTALICIGIVFTILTIIQTLITQRILINSGPRLIAFVYAFEIVLMVVLGSFFRFSAVESMFAFSTIRFMRILIISSEWFSQWQASIEERS